MNQNISTNFFKQLLITGTFVLGLFTMQVQAQPNMTIWRVDQAHLNNPTQGTALEWNCGYDYYITYGNHASSIDLILEIKNEGTANLVLSSTPSFSAGSSTDFSIVTPPAKLNLAPGEETHFVVRYSAPTSYSDASATLELESNDPNNGTCNFNFDVGRVIFIPNTPSIESLELSYNGTPTTSPVDIGDAVVGNSISKTFTLTNPSGNSSSANLLPCSGTDLITISGADAADFSVTTTPNNTIPIGGSTTFTIQFSPSSAGAKTANFCYDFSFGGLVGGGVNVVINGNGIAAVDPIPTMSEWGLLIFGLLVLNLGVFFLIKREELLNF